MAERPTPLLNRRDGNQIPVAFVELFFDLVFVFAIAQLSHLLLEDLTPVGAVKTLLLLAAVWWAWICTTWVTNWLDAEHPAVRLMLFGLMVLGLLLSTAIPEAFKERGLYFACAYASFQIGRTIFALWATWHDAHLRRNFIRVLIWVVITGTVWIAGGLADPGARLAIWGVALGLDLLSGLVRFYVPRLGSTPLAHWTIEGGHIAHRCGLFTIILLGEAVLLTGAAFTQTTWTAAAEVAFLNAIAAISAMWWIYFGEPSALARERIASMAHAALPALIAYTYLQILFVSGTLLTAVAAELVIAHPMESPGDMERAILVGGPLLYVAAAALFARVIFHVWKKLRLGTLAAILILALVDLGLPAIVLAILIACLLVALAAAEYAMWHGMDEDARHRLAIEPEAD